MLASPDAAGFQRAEVGTIERLSGVDGRRRDHVAQPHAKREEFRQCGHLVVDRPVDAQRVNVRRDRVGHKAFGQHGARGLPAERSLAVADVEDDAALARGQHRGLDLALAVDRRVRERAEAVGQHVSGTQPRDHLLVGGRRLVDVHHHRQAGFVGDLLGDVERNDSRRPARHPPYADLDADDEVAVGFDHLDAVARSEQPDVVAFSHHDPLREGVDPGEGDVQVGQDAHRAPLDHVLAEAGEIAGPSAAGVDAGRDRAAAGEVLGVDAERRASPIDVGVQIDEAGRDDEARHVAHLGALGFEALAHCGDLAAGEGDVGHAVEILRGVDHATVAKDEIEAMDPVFEASGADAQAALAVEEVHGLKRRRQCDRGAGRQSVRVGAGGLDHPACRRRRRDSAAGRPARSARVRP